MKNTWWAIAIALLAATGRVQAEKAFAGIVTVTDPAMRQSLNGRWKLSVEQLSSVDTADDDRSQLRQLPSAAATMRNGTCAEIPVPGCWEAYGFCQPSYDKARPLAGYYLTHFTLPQTWQGKRVVIQFDGVLYGYDLWVNGRYAGSWRSAYNTAQFDITDCINPKVPRQELFMRVITQFRGSDFDYNDDWAPCGIFRDVTLMAVPQTHLTDITIHPQNTGTVCIDAKIANAGRQTAITYEIIDAQGQVVGQATAAATQKKAPTAGSVSGGFPAGSPLSAQATVPHPRLWTAETPYLYTLRTRLTQKGQTLQTFEHKFGFRQLTIEGNVLKLNGQPIKLRGVTSHATDPHTVKVISDSLTLKDMRLMKEASVNYIRTSHYPREPRFYELADSLGFYVIDEVPFGYGDKHLSDSTFYPMLQERAAATIRRDKNHACVLIWSLGNENPLTDICVRLGHYVKAELDATRPVCYPQVGSYFRRLNYQLPAVADIYAPHYPSTSQIGSYYARTDRPLIFTEYCHTLGISLEDHDRQWELIEQQPGIAGGSVWEWVDQGMPFTGTKEVVDGRMYGYEEKVYTSANGGFEMNGNKGTDGLLYADRTPLPNYFELQHNYARAAVTDTLLTPRNGALELHLHNRFDFIDLKDHVHFCWALTADRDTLASGSFSPSCQPRHSAAYTLQLPIEPAADRLSLLHIEATDWQGNTFLRQAIPVGNQASTTNSQPAATSLQQRLLTGLPHPTASLLTLIQDGPLVRAGRKATMAEQLKVADRRLERYLIHPETADGPVRATIQTQAEGNATGYSFTLTTDSTQDHFLGELGIAFLLDPSIDRVQWIGLGPLPTYPGRYRAGRYGFWSLHKDDLYFEGNHRNVDAALFTDSVGNGLLLVCPHADVNFEQTDRGIVLSVNAAVAGQGPKFARTAFPVTSRNTGTLHGRFYLYPIQAADTPVVVSQLFMKAEDVPQPFRPFLTQYDTYLMRYADIVR